MSKDLEQPAETVIATLVFPIRENDGKTEVLLGFGTRGFNLNKWNGYGGKIEASDKTVAECATRELFDESGLTTKPSDLEYIGRLDVTMDQKTAEAVSRKNAKYQIVHIYRVSKFSGEAKASEEMANPTWWTADLLPKSDMPKDEGLWIYNVIKGNNFRVKVVISDVWDSNINISSPVGLPEPKLLENMTTNL